MDKKFVIIFGFIFLLLSICNPIYARSSARDKACFSNIRVITGAIELYNMDHNIPIEHYASNTEDLLLKGNYIKNKMTKYETQCEYKSLGNLTKDGFLYCIYHGDLNHLIYSEYYNNIEYENYEKIPQNSTIEEFKAKKDLVEKRKKQAYEKREIEEAEKRKKREILKFIEKYIVIIIVILALIFDFIFSFLRKKSKNQ